MAILIALTYLGGWLLRGFGISDAGSTSFLAVGLLAVVAMLFLVDSLDGWTGAVAVPVVTVVAYALWPSNKPRFEEAQRRALDLKPGSRLGVVGLAEACRRGTVTVVVTSRPAASTRLSARVRPNTNAPATSGPSRVGQCSPKAADAATSIAPEMASW